MKKRILYFIFFIITLLAAGYFFAMISEKRILSIQDSPEEDKQNPVYQAEQSSPPKIIIETVENQNASSRKAEEEKSPIISKKIEQTVPFVIQAPFGNWEDPNFQNACEEASMIMAMGWVDGEKTISPQEAQKRILEIIDFENKTFGYSTDTNASDVERIFREHFKHENVHAMKNITLEDVKTEIQKGSVVIVPAFGRALENPNFTQPGPVAHMLVIIGYDPLTRQFITNDPGTRKGAGYKYDESLLFEAIWEYPSGASDPPLPTAGNVKKALISVSK